MYTHKMNLMDTLKNHIPIQDNAIQYSDAYGIEVELEGKNILEPPIEVCQYWTSVKDGSLRCKNPGDQAIEYLFRMPFGKAHTEKAVSLLMGYLNSPGVKVYESYRTSIHVHVNFAMEIYRTIYNFMCLSLLLDELLVSQNGEHRVGNNFCLRAKDAMGQLNELMNSVNNGHGFFDMNQNHRYSSINFASLLKYGTVEFRSLECTTHEGRLMHWIGTLQQIKDKSKDFVNPTEIIQAFSALGPGAFLKNILGPYAAKYAAVEGANDMLFNGMRIAQDFAYCSEWKEFAAEELQKGMKQVKLAPKKKDPNGW